MHSMLRNIILLIVLLTVGVAFLTSPVFKEVSAGIAILLFGMIMLEKGFSSFANGYMQKILARATNRLSRSIGLGFLFTALIQSSSLISVVTISFISAGLITFQGGLGIIFGANLGTTATAWLVAIFGLKIQISALAMPMLAFGVILQFQKGRSWNGLGNVLAGLGFFFLGIHYMKEGFEGIGQSINLAEYAMPGVIGLLIYTGLGFLLTVVLQSSSATMALILTALSVGQVTYFNSLALAIGANIGTTVTAILGALGANVAGRRLAGGHLVFNVVTGIVALLLISPLASLVELIGEWVGLATDNHTIKLSIFHSIFNVMGLVIMVPFIEPLGKFLEKWVVARDPQVEGVEYPKYLNESAMAFPRSAFQALVNETRRLFEETTFMMISHGLNLHREDIKGDEKLQRVIERSREEIDIDIDELYYKKVKIIYSKIIKYATLSQSNFELAPQALAAFQHLKLANRNIVEIIKDTRGLHNNVSRYMLSDNPYMRKQYDRLRNKVSLVLREIYLAHHDEDSKSHLSRLQSIRMKSERSDALTDGTLDRLISEHRIPSEMATSLANDSHRVSGIIAKLIEVAELLYVDIDTYIVALEQKKNMNDPKK